VTSPDEPAAEHPAVQCDAVVLAAPLANAVLDLSGVPAPAAAAAAAARMHTTHCTFVAGQLAPAAFRLLPGTEVPPLILTSAKTSATTSATTSVAAMATVSSIGRLAANSSWVKIFSTEPLSAATLAALFATHDAASVHTRAWQAYPAYSPPEQLAPFRLAEGLFYVSAIEQVASAMEMSAVAAKNVALLVAQALAPLGPAGSSTQPRLREEL
jgi:prenylcysteine oxidase/farnesylcysteine lyase